MKKSHEIDMTDGAIFPKLIMFVLPLMASGVLQLFFNAADVIIVGKFAGSLALAAVGSNGALINLLVNMFIGISTGANVLVARFFGSHEYRELDRCIHCAMALSVVLGITVGVLGALLSAPLLYSMNVDKQVLPLASLYLRIYFVGIPAAVIYNFGAAILRAVGDTERPLQFLLIAGVINVMLNLLLVVVFRMSVAGVAIATAVSQYISAFLVVRCLARSDSFYRVRLKALRIYRDMLLRILQIGIPAGLQSTFFSFSNVMIQSSINSFGYVSMAANSAASNLEGFVYIATNALHHAGVSFISQNYGAQKFDRVRRIAWISTVSAFSLATILSLVLYLAAPALLSLYIPRTDSDYSKIVAAGMVRLLYVGMFYGFCGIMDTVNGCLRGMGQHWLPMTVTLLGVCGLRVFWIYSIFAVMPSLKILYLSYPASWILTSLILAGIMITSVARQSRLSPSGKNSK